RGTTELLVFEHGTSPGARWSRDVAIGDGCRFVGPQRSIRRSPDRFAVVFGDETSFAVASALFKAGRADAFVAVFEVGSRADAEPVI
ncbi:hypothetical protein, partial [Vibrio parahaemolyticus]|uniref:hypothetical protein n=1 Tax=Vibrio parahaemolyticus TaxID=670 RepID=UPI002111B810